MSYKSRCEYAERRLPVQEVVQTAQQNLRILAVDASRRFDVPLSTILDFCKRDLSLAAPEYGVRGRARFRWQIDPGRLGEILNYRLDREDIAARFGVPVETLTDLDPASLGRIVATLPLPLPQRRPFVKRRPTEPRPERDQVVGHAPT